MGAAPPRDLRIFMSHSSADNALGVRLAEDLRRVLGDPTAVWYDSAGGLQPGAAWWQTIVKEVMVRPIFLVIWSPDARDSQWVNDEVDLAWQEKNSAAGKTIIPLIWRPCDIRGDLRTRQAIMFDNLDEYDNRFLELLAALGIATAAPEEGLSQAAIPTHPPARAAQPEASESTTLTASRPSELLLFSIDGLWPPNRFPLHGSSVTIGRESGNDLLLADPAVSRFHLKLVRHLASWRAEALPDAKPMYINGEQRRTALLGHGDQVVIGGTVLRIEQPMVAANSTTLQSTDMRTVLASGLPPEMRVEMPQLRFSAPLRTDIVTVGRAPENALIIPSPLISAHQAVIRRKSDGAFEIESLPESRNAFALDGRPLTRHTLRNGDTLNVGSRAQNVYVTLAYVDASATLA